MSDVTNPGTESNVAQVDHAKLAALYARMEGEQSFIGGLIGGLVTAIAGACIWAAITAATMYQIGWMAVGVGFLVGFGVRIMGKGVSKTFGIMGAVLSLLGCLLGNLLSVCFIVANQQDLPVMTVLSTLNPTIAIEWIKITFQPMDLLFYAIAVYEGYRFSFRQLSEEDLRSVMVEQQPASV